MDHVESANAAVKSPGLASAICWECGENRECYEYVVCCTGTLFHICPICEDRVNRRDQSAADQADSDRAACRDSTGSSEATS